MGISLFLVCKWYIKKSSFLGYSLLFIFFSAQMTEVIVPRMLFLCVYI